MKVVKVMNAFSMHVFCTIVENILFVLGHQLFWFASRSDSPGTNYGRCVDILAPGQWIRSASYM